MASQGGLEVMQRVKKRTSGGGLFVTRRTPLPKDGEELCMRAVRKKNNELLFYMTKGTVYFIPKKSKKEDRWGYREKEPRGGGLSVYTTTP